MNLVEFPNLNPGDYEHPLDARSLDMLEGTPGLEPLTKAFLKHGIERMVIVTYTGSHLRVTPRSFPQLHQILEEVCSTVNLRRLPRLYVRWDDSVNGLTVGDEEPILILTSGAVDRLSDDETRFLLGHEIGHIKSRHTRYHMIANTIFAMSAILGDLTLGLGRFLTTPVKVALLRWYRMSELTADRVGLLACQSLPTATSVFVKIAGLPQRFNDSPCIDDFLQQARDFEELDLDKVTRWVKFAVGMKQSHPWTVARAAELIRWIDSGEYDALLTRAACPMDGVAVDGGPQCSSCGAHLDGSDAFCGNCGKRTN